MQGGAAVPGVCGHLLEISCKGYGSGRAARRVPFVSRKSVCVWGGGGGVRVALAPRAETRAKLADSVLFWTPVYKPLCFRSD